MNIITQTQIDETCYGFLGHSTYKLLNGQIWQQYGAGYEEYFVSRPNVTITEDNGIYMMAVEGMKQPVQVKQVYVISEGTIISEFTGLEYRKTFTFSSGEVWEQIDNKYIYKQLYQPYAYIIDAPNGYELKVQEISESVRVEKRSG